MNWFIKVLLLQLHYCSCSCSIFSNMRLKKLVYWIICNVMHLSLPNLVHSGSLIFWIDSKEYWFSCSCSIVAAAAGLFSRQVADKSSKLKCLYSDLFITAKLGPQWLFDILNWCCCCCCSCSNTAAAVVLLLKQQYCCCSCSAFSRHKTKLNNHIPNLSIFRFHQPGLTSITAAAAVEALFWINADYQTTSV